jgi:hypothetical protein
LLRHGAWIPVDPADDKEGADQGSDDELESGDEGNALDDHTEEQRKILTFRSNKVKKPEEK